MQNVGRHRIESAGLLQEVAEFVEQRKDLPGGGA